ncbi:MAG: hypothetical protein JWO00_504 [Candidatus Parcubacteria bacterium]|nr:hypothetical protein [Candidatus Parcubacteria bacterium]
MKIRVSNFFFRLSPSITEKSRYQLRVARNLVPIALFVWSFLYYERHPGLFLSHLQYLLNLACQD